MRRTALPIWILLVTVLPAVFRLAAGEDGAAARDDDPTGRWEGAIETPGGKLGVGVDLERSASGWSGTIDIPAQGAAGLPLADVAVEGDRVRFRIAGVPGAPTFDGTLGEGEIRGTFRQGAAELPFRLGREPVLAGVALPAAPARPQEPAPPFPYRAEEVVYEGEGGVRLAGTVTVPPGEGPFPAVVLLTGSGAQDRDQTILGHRPFAVIADRLGRSGVAVLRADDRGVGGSAGDLARAELDDLAADALAGVRLLAGRPEVAAGRVGLLGHSEGGAVAALAAARSPEVAFLVLLAAPGVPGAEITARQVELLSRAAGVGEEAVAEQVALNRELTRALAGEMSDAELREKVREVVDRQRELGGQVAPEHVEALVEATSSPAMRAFLRFDPAEALARVRVPVLAVAGSLDLQVDPAQNLPAIERALARAGNDRVTVRTFEGLNHLLQPAESGLPTEYERIETTISPEVLDLLVRWIRRLPPAAAPAVPAVPVAAVPVVPSPPEVLPSPGGGSPRPAEGPPPGNPSPPRLRNPARPVPYPVDG